MRTIRDEDPSGEEGVAFEDVRVKVLAKSGKAILCVIGEDEHWIPVSQLHDNSEIYVERGEIQGSPGRLVITQYIAREKGLV